MINTNYRKDIDGLRAVAVLMAVFFHAGYKGFSGGFIGVNVFFVISGYVVSMMLLKNMKQGHFSFADFYARRAKRLAPALYTMLLAACILGYLFLPPDFMSEITLSTKYVAIFWSNVFFAGRSTYFDNWAEMKPLLHTWSLSIEEQFYLLLPVSLYYSLGKSFNLKRTAWLVGIVGIISLVYSQYTVDYVQNNFGSFNKITRSSFFFITSRAFEFVVGVLIALFVFSESPKVAKYARWVAPVALPLGLIGLFLCSWLMTNRTPFPGLMALIPDLLAGLILFSGVTRQRFAWVLENPLCVFFGKISYCLYLWHWLVFFSIRYATGGLSMVNSVIAIAISIALSIATHYLIESKLRHIAIPTRTALVFFVALPMLCAYGVSKLSGMTNGFEFRMSEKEMAIDKAQLDSLYTQPMANLCHTRPELPPDTCRVGVDTIAPNAVLWGDSLGYHMLNFVERVGKAYNLNVRTITHNGCAPIRGADPSLPAGQQLCVHHNEVALDFILNNPDIRYVFLGSAGSGIPQGKQFEEILDTLQKAGKKVFIFDGAPIIKAELANCQLKNERLPKPFQREGCTYPESEAITARGTLDIGLAGLKAKYPNVQIITIHDVLCDQGTCYSTVNGLPVYKKLDLSHLNGFGSESYFDLYRKKHPDELETLLGKPANPIVINESLKLGGG